MTRRERARQAAALRAQGMLYREIAAHLGITTGYAQELVTDPDGSRVRARRDRYRGRCRDCGAPTGVSRGRDKALERCRPCWDRYRTLWTREAIVERIQAWVELYGRTPTATDWNPGMAEAWGRPDIADRFRQDGCWPYTTTVQVRFGSWNDAIRAAGYTPRKPGGREPSSQPPAVPLALVEDEA